MRKFLSRRDKRRSLSGEGKSDKALDNHDSDAGAELECVQEDTASIFGSSSYLSKRASMLTDSFKFTKTEDHDRERVAGRTSGQDRDLNFGRHQGNEGRHFTSHASGSVSDTPHHKAHILHSLSSKRSSTSLYLHSQQQQQQHNVQSLVIPDWDTSLIKTGWLNVVNEDSSDDKLKLCRAELKGSTLFVYRSPQELASTSHFIAGQRGDDKDPESSSFSQDYQANLMNLSGSQQQQQQQLDSVNNMSTDTPISIDSSRADNEMSQISPSNTSESIASIITPDSAQLNDQLQKLCLVDAALDDSLLAAGNLIQAIRGQKGTEENFRGTPVYNYNTSKPVVADPEVGHTFSDFTDITYPYCRCPHPDLQFEDKTGVILGGTIESLCHTIVFYPSEDVAEKLIRILPMVTDIATPLALFQLYLRLFASISQNQDEADNQTQSNSDNSSSNRAFIPMETRDFMIKRISRCLKVIAKDFSGMLLDDSILRSIWNVMMALDDVSDCNDLKTTIHEQQKSLRMLLQFENTTDTLSLSIFTADYFMSAPLESLAFEINALDHKFLKAWNARDDRSLTLDRVHQSFEYWRKNFLVFDAIHNIHYLGRLICYQLFEDPETENDASSRAHILEKWILLGELLYRQGNMSSWLGISTFMCSVPILRLRDTWGKIDNKIVDLVRKSWAPIIFEVRQRRSQQARVGLYRVLVPAGIGRNYAKEDVIPYYGDIYFQKPLKLPEDYVKSFCAFSQKADYSIAKWDEFYQGVTNSDSVRLSNASKGMCGSVDISIAQKLRFVVNYTVKNKPFSLSDAMSLSLGVEKPSEGQYFKYHNRSRSPLFLGSYASILFPKILDAYEIYDRKSLIGAIGGVGLTQSVLRNSAYNISNLMKHGGHSLVSSKSMNRNTFLKHIRDVFNIDTFEFKETDDTIMFKTVLDSLEQERKVSKHTSKSRPSSILFGENISVKRFSSYSTSSFNLDDFVNSYHSFVRESSDGDGESVAVVQPLESPVIASSSRSSAEASARKLLTQGEQLVSIVAEAATSERLLDLLVLTSSIFSSKIKEEDVKRFAEISCANGRSFLLRMDQGAFTVTFFAVYRCFMSPYELISGLQKRFAGSKRCSISIASKALGSSSTIFPEWSPTVTGDTVKNINWKFVAQIELGVVESLLALFQHYYKHLLDDMETREAIESLFECIGHELDVTLPSALKDMRSQDEPDRESINAIEKCVRTIIQSYKDSKEYYVKNCYTPLVDPLPLRFTSDLSIIPADKILARYNDTKALSRFVDGIDETIRRIMSSIIVEDWIETFQILEVLTAKSTLSLFNYDVQSLDTSSPLLVVSNIYHWIATLVDIESSTSSKLSFVVDKFPSSVRSMLRFYFKLKNYFTVQLIDPSINFEHRIERMAAVLKLLVISRIKMRELELFSPDETDTDISPRVPSLIESCLVNTILSPECRFFSFDWCQASKLLSPSKELDQCHTYLDDLLPDEKDISAEISLQSHLTPCPGWILQSLLEITCFIPNMYVQNTSLINFDKDRFAYNCVVNIMDLVPKTTENLDKESLFSFLLDFKIRKPALKEVYETFLKEKEAEGYEEVSTFLESHLNEQRQLMKVEDEKKNLLLKQKPTYMTELPLPSSIPSSSVSSGAIVDTPKTTLGASKRNGAFSTSAMSSESTLVLHRTRSAVSIRSESSGSSKISRFKFSGLFSRASKGLNIGHGSNSQQVVEKSPCSFLELPPADNFVRGHKAKILYTLNLKDSSAFPTYVTPYSFKIDFGNGRSDEYCFQATDDLDRDDWLRNINYSHRHWFFSKALNKSSMGVQANMVFGVPLKFVCIRENRPIPNIIEKIMSEIEFRGLEEVGLYRRSASLASIQKIKDKINRFGDFNMEDQLVFDVHNLTGCIKSYLRELPDPLIGDSSIGKFTEVKELSKDDKRFDVYREIFCELPVYNYNLLERLFRHLKLVVDYKQCNKMTSSNLATILGGSLIEGCNPENLRNYFGLMTFVCEDLILNYDRIFLNAARPQQKKSS
ncbi:hypothetical protein FOA43_003565 [Brettanomyces nanus]|uniref:Rho-GAP domain-containing protein n=1 Tax=Eeniella nana TaxID=13502 RepID=A0A875S942_EENNA|nr:uncharacterized protein FOA43_003565 [Brettanomyces nanus]QPG76179.1 hypothetical protein FOA43_003565 [Brettanomyces nanus]